MRILIFLLQIEELFDGHFNWRGLLQLLLLVFMGLIAISFAVFVSYKAFRSKPKK